MCETIKLPKYLRGHKSKILGKPKSARRARYNPEVWLQFFDGNGVVVGDLRAISQECPETIARDDIVALAHKALSGGYTETRRLFLATMIWGWGNRKIGLQHTKNSLSSPKVEEVLRQSVEQVREGKLIEAYKGFDLAGCGPAFFTKLFYFVGLACGSKPLPVILDSKVTGFLEFLGEQEEPKHDYLTEFAKVNRDEEGKIVMVGKYPDGYVKFVGSMDSWANQLGCRADAIECFMFGGGHSVREKGGQMAKNSKRLPLRCAKSFAKSKGLQQQVAWLLKKVNKPKEWSDDHFEEARKGKFIELFYTKGYWEDFKRKCWPNAESTDGQERIEKHYRPRAQGLNADLRAKGLSILWQLSEVEWGNVISPINQVPLQVSLPKEKMRQLNILARELDEEPSTLAKIWIVEHLCKLCKDGP